MELAIQHGEEAKVSYDLIDYAIGTYRDIVLTGLLTAEEYAAGTNESVSEVKKRIETAELISRFLDYIRLPGQYHVAKEYQVYSMFTELLPLLTKCKTQEDKQRLMRIVFNAVILKPHPDQRKLIRDIKKLMTNAIAPYFLAEQDQIAERVSEAFEKRKPTGKADLEAFADDQKVLADDMLDSMERNLLRVRTQNLVNRPTENVTKCKNLLVEIDPRLFSRLDEEEKQNLRAELDYLARMAENLKAKLM